MEEHFVWMTTRRSAMARYVVDEQEAFYRGRELIVPAH
jgi:hypothetical protein